MATTKSTKFKVIFKGDGSKFPNSAFRDKIKFGDILTVNFFGLFKEHNGSSSFVYRFDEFPPQAGWSGLWNADCFEPIDSNFPLPIISWTDNYIEFQKAK